MHYYSAKPDNTLPLKWAVYEDNSRVIGSIGVLANEPYFTPYSDAHLTASLLVHVASLLSLIKQEVTQ
jgi:hypothetical protein